ncbi:hypothetical protein [Streptomyces sp. NPDC002889]|uniref:hypothetical protein n=1 Tax=Streptomyces sp. NPDC002889 TaxID=3364669 RepID=UPI00367CFBE8
MTEIWTTATAGAVAGLGVAMPVGAMGVLLVQEAMRDRRGAMAAAAAVASADLAYAAVATGLGPLVASALSGVEAWVRLVSAAILTVIAARGLWASRHPTGAAATATGRPRDARPRPGARQGGSAAADAAAARAGRPGRREGPRPAAPEPGPGDTRSRPGATTEAEDASVPAASTGPRRAGSPSIATGETGTPARAAAPGRTSAPRTRAKACRRAGAATPARVFARFAALTLINPTTALYFAALTTAQGATLRGVAGSVFVAGVFVASMAWQQLLVAVSGLAGARISDKTHAWTFRIGYGFVAVYAVKVALPLP